MLQSTTNLAPAPTTPLSPFLNRELSWLDFNQRVLDLATDTSNPLLERVRFLAIFSSNLDEFFMKRVGGLERQLVAHVSELSADGLTPEQQIDAIHAKLGPMLETHVKCWMEDLKPALEREGVFIRDYEKLDELDRTAADDFFVKKAFPILTPLTVDPGHPFPFISNLSNSVGVMLEHPTRKDRRFVRIKVPENLPRWVPLPNKLHFVPLEQVMGANLSLLFPGMIVVESQPFRVTRNADIEMDAEDADDLLQLVEQELRARRMARVVRLELAQSMSPIMREFIVSGVEVDPRSIYSTPGPLDMSDLFVIANLDLPHLKFKPWTPTTPPRLAGEDVDIFAVIRAGDLMVHHPYESFAESVEKFIATAVLDPKVLAIKMTLYRTTADSPFVLSLIHAAESGKQVAVLVELKARFDEQRNVELAQTLETAGVHVVYGVLGLKTHTKLVMIVREESDGLRTYCHIGTGNYNSRTAQMYTDLGLFTCNPLLTGDVIDLFHYLTGQSLKRDYRMLLVAPVNMRERFVLKIRREAEHAKAGRPAHITAKMNALQDSKIITELYDASRAGVKIELFVRGFCCLRPGVAGMSENIRITSILGRFLEHSRIYHFLNGGEEEFYIGSADWMNRNLDFRVEAVTPIVDPSLRERLREILQIMRNATGNAWELHSDGNWQRVRPKDGQAASDPQMALMALALKQARKPKPGR
ncbi:MAG: polyphosphate kinase 1 [Tepidisphaeraceae bacterium]|jgi:polyphosphate kinase